MLWDSASLWRVSAPHRIRHSDSLASFQTYVMREKVGVICVMPSGSAAQLQPHESSVAKRAGRLVGC